MSERDCSLTDYTSLLKNGVIRLILDAEDLAYRATDCKSKEEWPEDVMASFLRIRHKLLDTAGEIGRIPENLFVETSFSQLSPRVAPVAFSQDVAGTELESVEAEEETPKNKRWGIFGFEKERSG